MKRILSLIVAIILCMSMVSVLAEGEMPEYLNTDGYYPMVKEGYDVPLKFGIVVSSDYNDDPMARYYWNLMKEVFNIDVEVIQVTNLEEYVTLTFAADDLPDVLIGVGLTPSQLYNYGVLEEQLLDIAPYLSEELTPRMMEIYEMYPEIKAGLTAPNGAIYTFPYIIADDNPTLYSRASVNMTMLEEAGIAEKPHTLDELITALYAMKELGDDVIPLAGNWNDWNPSAIILKALGYETRHNNDNAVKKICLNNGKVTVAGADEGYLDYLTIMNQFYTDGIIDPDFFTIDITKMEGQAVEKRLGVFIGSAGETWNADPAFFQQYEALPALTSERSETPVSTQKNFWTAGGCVISAKTEYPELCLRWADWMMTTEGTHAAWVGAHKANENIMLDGWGGWYMNENYARMDVDREENPDKWTGAVEYLRKCVAGFEMGSLGWVIGEDLYRQTMSGLEVRDQLTVWSMDPTNAGYYFRVSAYDEYTDLNVVDISDFMFFFDEDTNDRIIELESQVGAHIVSETAKFITGERPLDEFDAYLQELGSLGVNEYIGYYADAYAQYLSNL